MDTKINYSIVGFFVFTSIILMSAFLFWMIKFGLEEKKFDSYKIEMIGSVAGLNKNAPVKFRGVYIGFVDQIYINKTNSELIDIEILVEQNTPIKEDNFAVLAAQGITGLSYIELKGGSKNSKVISPNSIINADKSMFDKIESSAEDISKSVLQTLKKVDGLLSDENLDSINMLLKNLNKVDGFLSEENIKNVALLLKNLNASLKMIHDQSSNIEELMKNGIVAQKELIKTLKSYDDLAIKLNSEIDNGAFDVKGISDEYKSSIESLMEDLKRLSLESTNLVKELQNSPSDILFKKEIEKLGPGERR
jgi:phospholipid/cholesterol/gamma-HCH transport system substrate-binding protein